MSKLPYFKPSHLEVNRVYEVQVVNIGQSVPNRFQEGSNQYPITILKDGQEMLWYVSDRTFSNNNHLFNINGRIAIRRSKGQDGRDNYTYSAPGDITMQPQNIPQGHDPQLNTRQQATQDQKWCQINTEKRSDIWRGQSLNLTLEYFVDNPMESPNSAIIKEWQRVYEAFGPEMIYGFKKAAEKRKAKKEALPLDPEVEELPWETELKEADKKLNDPT